MVITGTALATRHRIKFYGIDKALKEDRLVMRAFGIGGGNRVVRIEHPLRINMPGEVKGYGEAPNLLSALVEADTDYLRGGSQEYRPVSGQLENSDIIDKWVGEGSYTFYARASERKIMLTAGTSNYKEVLSVAALTFGRAYELLLQALGPEHFKRARKVAF